MADITYSWTTKTAGAPIEIPGEAGQYKQGPNVVTNGVTTLHTTETDQAAVQAYLGIGASAGALETPAQLAARYSPKILNQALAIALGE